MTEQTAAATAAATAHTNKWLALVKMLAPIILASVKPELAPIGQEITDAIGEAEQIKGKSGPEKLEHVKNIAKGAARAVNTAKGKEVIDPANLDAAITAGVNTVVEVANVVTKSSAPEGQ